MIENYQSYTLVAQVCAVILLAYIAHRLDRILEHLRDKDKE